MDPFTNCQFTKMFSNFVMWKCIQTFEHYAKKGSNLIDENGLMIFRRDLGFENIFHVSIFSFFLI